jgi:hypothetical protein
MLSSITPLGERGRGSIWSVTVGAFALGASVAGGLAGALAGLLGALALPAALGAHARLAALAGALAIAAALDGLRRSPLGPHRQVNERWLDEFRGWVYGLGFGAQLGLGLTTVVTSAATYAALLAAILTRSPPAGAAIVGSFGLVRGLTPLLAARVRTPAALFGLHSALAEWSARSRLLAIAGLAFASLVATYGALA